MLTLDHIAIAGSSLEVAAEYVEKSLGVPLQAGGRHAHFGTHNRLLGLEDGLYLEAIATDPSAPKLNYARWFDMDGFTGPARFTNWICRSDDLVGDLKRFPSGMDMGQVVHLERGDLRWRMAVPQDGVLPFDNCAPAIMQWDVDFHPAASLALTNVRLTRLVVSHPQAYELAGALDGLLSDNRLAFETADAPGLRAEFATPKGERALEMDV